MNQILVMAAYIHQFRMIPGGISVLVPNQYLHSVSRLPHYICRIVQSSSVVRELETRDQRRNGRVT